MKVELNRGDFVYPIIPIFCDDLSVIETGLVGRVTGITGRKVRVFYKELKRVINVSIDLLQLDKKRSDRKRKLKKIMDNG